MKLMSTSSNSKSKFMSQKSPILLRGVKTKYFNCVILSEYNKLGMKYIWINVCSVCNISHTRFLNFIFNICRWITISTMVMQGMHGTQLHSFQMCLIDILLLLPIHTDTQQDRLYQYHQVSHQKHFTVQRFPSAHFPYGINVPFPNQAGTVTSNYNPNQKWNYAYNAL